jgi:hypothetical protein
MPISAYPALTTAEQIFKDLVWTPAILAGETWLEAEVPALNLPGLKQLDEEAIKALSNWLFSQVVLVIDIETIQLVNSEHQSAYDKASEALAVIAEENGVKSDEYKKAQSAALAELSRFTRIGP